MRTSIATVSLSGSLEQKLAARSRSLVLDVPDAPAETASEPQTTPRV